MLFAQAARKDATAIGTVAQTLAATGWIAPPNVIVASGTVTRFVSDDDPTLQVTLTFTNSGKFRSVVQDRGEQITTVVDGKRGAVTKNSETRILPTFAALSIKAPFFPFFTDLLSTGVANVEVRDDGEEKVQGQVARRIRIIQLPGKSDPLAAARALFGDTTIWLSATTGLPIQMEYGRIAVDNPRAVTRYLHVYSNYKTVDGVLLPMTHEQYCLGRLEYRLEFTSVQINPAVSDSDFAVPAKGGK